MPPLKTEDIEKKTVEIGTEIIHKINAGKGALTSFFSGDAWSENLIGLSLKNEKLKQGLFQFIDVLPSLKNDREAVSHFTEYLGEFLEAFPPALSKGLQWMGGKALSPVSARLIRSAIESLSGRFIIGKDFNDAVSRIKKLNKSKRGVTLDLLGELTLCESDALAYQGRYLDLLSSISDCRNKTPDLLPPSISVKVSSLYSRLDPADWDNSIKTAAGMIGPIFEKAAALNIPVILDMESYYYRDLIVEIFLTLIRDPAFRKTPPAGIALQLYLNDGLVSLQKIVSAAREIGRPIDVRLVKGAYWDHEMALARQRGWPVPVLEQKEETDAQYEEAVRWLLEEGRPVRTVLGSHNIRSLSYALAVNALLGKGPDNLEIQMLYGMAEPLQNALAEMGYPVRVYAPVGEILPGMAYLIRRLMENTANNSILHQTFSGQPVSMDILKPPAPVSSCPISPNTPTPYTLHPDPRLFKNCPPLDFSIHEVRKNVAGAISRLEAELSRATPFYAALINGKKVTTGKTLSSPNPANPMQILGEVAQCSEREVNEAIVAAMAAKDPWKKTPSGERAELLIRTADHLEKERNNLMAFEIMEAGKSWREADGDICEAIDFLRYYAGEMNRLEYFYRNPGTVSSIPGEENRLIPQPAGVMAAIPPWNFPLALATGMIAAGVVAGNCVIFKPSSLGQVLGAKIMEAFLEAGVPQGVLQFLPGEGRSVGELLVRHPQIALIAFTGSNEVGRHILSSAATLQPGQKQFKRVIAEMGGKNAVIVDDGADLDEAVSGVVESAFGYQGQKCSACSRVIVLRSVYADFTRRLVSAAEDLVRGDPRSPSVFLGPVIDEKARKKIEGYIKLGIETAKPLYVRKEEESSGHFIGPAIFDNVPSESPLAREEIFGPVLSVFQAETFDDALSLANDSLFGLTGGLYSRKPSHIEKAREVFHAGNLYINRKTTGAIVGRQPFGGFNLSGVGAKTGGPDYLPQFMQVKSVSENTRRKGYIP